MTAQQWQRFHQHESLTTRLANILEEYPPGVSTLREYVQNADDAGAKRLVLCLDCGSGGACEGALPTEALRAFTGTPALLVFNDATFSEKDYSSISSIGKSRKREDAATIGKYGLGFNVSYHFTDLVQFVSGDDIVLFDPHGTSLPDGELGMRARFTDGLGRQFPALLDPLLCPLARLSRATAERQSTDDGKEVEDPARHSTPVDATLFRLPLRTPEQAAASELSRRPVAADDVRTLLRDFCENGLGEMLLFTQTLQTVEACVIETDGSMTHLGRASVESGAPAHRAALAGISRGLSLGDRKSVV